MAVSNFTRQDWRTYDLDVDEGFMSVTDYPDPSSEEVRKQLQSQHSQLQDYVNNTVVTALNDRYTKSETQNKIDEAVIEAGAVTYDVVEGMISDAEANISKVFNATVPDSDNEFSVLKLTNATLTVKDSNNNTVTFKIEVVA